MPMAADEIEAMIKDALPGAEVEALGGNMGGVLHALQLTTEPPK